jgi:predicted metalloprotease
MKWEGNRQSNNIEDRRGMGGIGGRSIGIGSVVIALIASAIFGVDPGVVLNLLSGGPSVQQSQAPARTEPANDKVTQFVSTVLADTEDTWTEIFRSNGAQYQQPKLVLFSGQTPTACGTGQSATGPFYCPGDQKVYIDLTFFRLMQQRFNVSGEFAQAYVIAHEVGHHVQNIMGIMDKVDSIRRSGPESQANALSVRLELQADCFAGVWAYHANQSRNILESGDLVTALNAATAIGDDALQKKSQGYVVPDSFTHGSSAQRVRWFKRGIETGKVSSCNTFNAQSL